MNLWDEDKQETEGALPISGREAVEEALNQRIREEALLREAEEKRQAEAAQEAARLARERQLQAMAEQEERRRRQEDYERQKAAAEKARRRMKRRSFISVLAGLLALGALVFGLNNYLELRSLRNQINNLKDQMTGVSASRSKPSSLTENSKVEGVSLAAGAEGSLTDVSDIVSQVIPSVVSIETQGTVQMNSSFYGRREYQTSGAGSGVIIGGGEEELWVLTNYHVIDDATDITLIFVDGETAAAYVKGSSQENDLAVLGVMLKDLKESTRAQIRSAAIGSSDDLELGEGVIAIGNALGFGQSVTTGVVSGLERSVTFSDGTTMKLLQISAAINPGNSGGALLNAKGELIGINNAKYSDEEVEGIGFAIPISSIRDIMTELSSQTPRVPVSQEDYPYLGITFKNLSSSYTDFYGIPAGAYVSEVGIDSPAAQAGILAYDVITEIDGVKLNNFDDLARELRYHAGGSTVKIKLKRLVQGSYQEIELSLTLGYKKDYSN